MGIYAFYILSHRRAGVYSRRKMKEKNFVLTICKMKDYRQNCNTNLLCIHGGSKPPPYK